MGVGRALVPAPAQFAWPAPFWVFCVCVGLCVILWCASVCARVHSLVVARVDDTWGWGARGSLVSDPPRMHELAPCSLYVRVCAYIFLHPYYTLHM